MWGFGDFYVIKTEHLGGIDPRGSRVTFAEKSDLGYV